MAAMSSSFYRTTRRSMGRGWLTDRAAEVLRDPLVVDGRAEDGAQVDEKHRAGRRGKLANKAGVPLADMARLDGGQLAVAEVRQ
ncbi:hypothetical protein ACFOW4_24810 [Micromonospora sp. GCM10011542]|uniref:hypothetical protein n=1 Tax=Micromonospora sp. GCM10011542 TaxID=3317337 RepID=UPI0036080D76